jgi:hypothetical protein
VGKGVKPKTLPKGVNGNKDVTTTTAATAKVKIVPGREEKNQWRVRMISATIAAEATDSMNHPVLNSASVARIQKNKTPNVR